MELRLTLEAPERLLGGRTDATLRDGAMVIGRSWEADWPIADPKRIISKVHCRIEKDFDSYQLTDLSTNGVTVNEKPVGYGLVCRIENGDVVKLGDAVLTVRIVATSQPDQSAAQPAGQHVPPKPAPVPIAEGPFGDTAAVPIPAAPSIGPPINSPVAPSGPQTAEKGVVLEDWWNPAGEQTAATPSNLVDISSPPDSDPFGHVHAHKDTLLSDATGVASLLRMAAGLGVDKLALAVGEAATVLSAEELAKFKDRLSDLLRGA